MFLKYIIALSSLINVEHNHNYTKKIYDGQMMANRT
jgi:hypothetical protein